ncbi:hypothetical protein BGP89_11035 [Luteimonas sp. JM171]|uniref:hypothetical protein n=1 Tax=Luteimonas sp. JM171 TaxID=1896164 RepID=UPI000858DC22|nr:hypothetical protein [Luteimonas sp. JM171]AOH36819.1 hypothetical protein BGP89_11035 [Luteimonas sp. JM171]
MNPIVEYNLTLILFLPWFLVLGAVYWWLPRQPRPLARVTYDIVALAVSLAAFLWSVYWSMDNADTGYGTLWPQILATALGYGVFLAVLTLAFLVRALWLARLRARAWLTRDTSTTDTPP